MNELIEKDETNIENMIYEVRGKQVMLDSDLAKLYQCKNGTKVINQAVSRHKDRFPEDFCFQLTKQEYINLRSQFVTANSNMIRTQPYVFTEEGIAMLATILRTDVAAKVSINIMKAFVAMRHYIGNSQYRLFNVESKALEHDERIKVLEKTFDKFKEKDNEIYYKGQIYDAYSRIIDLFNKAKIELIIIDRYADKSVLDMIKSLNIHITLITKEGYKLSKLDISKYNEQYDNLQIIYNDNFHDRYFIIDKIEVYHCGTSINSAGIRIFSLNKLTDDIVKNNLLNYIVDTINLDWKMV